MSTDYLSGFLLWLERSLASEGLAALSDQQLLERFLASRDELAFRAIIARHGPMVYRVCRRVLSQDKDSEDAFQAVFLVLIRKASSIRTRQSLASWLHGVAVQIALRVRTSSQRRQLRESALAGRDRSKTADDRSWKEVRAILDEELARMPEKLRTPLVLCYLEGLTQDEAAEQLGQSKRTMQRCLERGRALLGLRLTRRGLTLSGGLLAALISECVEAMPPHLSEAASSFVEAKNSMRLSKPASKLAEEAIEMMTHHPLNQKWIAAAFLSACIGGAALASFLVGKEPQEKPPSIPESGSVVSVPSTEHRAPSAAPVTFEQSIADARKKAIDFLKQKQTKEGHWEGTLVETLADMDGGVTALATLALLEAGVPPNDETIQRTVEYLIKLPPKKTYVVSLQTQVLARIDAKKHQQHIQKNADWLVKEAVYSNNELAGWSYPGNSIADGSNTHFAVMGLHAAAQGGVKVEEKVWNQIIGFYLRTRLDKGWSYYSAPKSVEAPTKSMTACAVVGITLAVKHLHALEIKGLDTAITKGFELLDTWDYENSKSCGYALMVVAELGRARETREFKIADKTWEWYRLGAKKIIGVQQADGSLQFGKNAIDQMPILNTAFGLFFLGPPDPIQKPKEPVKSAEPVKSKAISPEIIEAWVKAGARFGHFKFTDYGYLAFEEGTQEGELPGFNSGERYSKLDLSKLPAPDAPFGLLLQPYQTTNWRDIASLKNLQALDIRSTANITDTEVKELAALKHLEMLFTQSLHITVAGVKELAAMKQLRTLSLRDLRVEEIVEASDTPRKTPRGEASDTPRKRPRERSNQDEEERTILALRELTALKQLQCLKLLETEITDQGLKELAAFDKLQSLTVQGANVTDEGMKPLGVLKQLRSLCLDCGKVGDAGMKYVASLDQLQVLELHCRITDAGLKELAALKQLRILNLPRAPVTDAGLKYLAGLMRLESMRLDETKITGTGFKELAALKQLKTLWLRHTAITDAGVKELTAFKQLRELDLSNTDVSDEGAKALAVLTELTSLRLDTTLVTDASLKDIAMLKNLQELYLDDTQITNAGLRELAPLKQLRYLNVQKTSVTAAGVRAFDKLLPKCRLEYLEPNRDPGDRKPQNKGKTPPG